MSPQTFFLERPSTPIGELLLLTDEAERVRVLDFGDYDERMRRLLRRHYGAAGYRIEDAPSPTKARQALGAYFTGDLTAIDGLQVETGGTPFQRRSGRRCGRSPWGRQRATAPWPRASGAPRRSGRWVWPTAQTRSA